MVNVFAASAVDRGFEPRSCQTKDCQIGISAFMGNLSRYWLARNQDKSERSELSTSRLLFQ